MNADIRISNLFAPKQTVAFIGRHADLVALTQSGELPDQLSERVWTRLLGKTPPTERARVDHTHLDGPQTERVFVCVLPERISRYNSPSRAIGVPAFVRALSGQEVSLLALIGAEASAKAVAIAVAKGLHTYGRSPKRAAPFHLSFKGPDGMLALKPVLQPVVNAVRAAAHLTDSPPNSLQPKRFVDLICQFADKQPSVSVKVISGEDLKAQGFHGLYSVGKAALHPPALVQLELHNAPGQPFTAWVGKGITYDTGGLSLKTKLGMVSMKRDMGGAAAVFGAFMAAVNQKRAVNLRAILCIAENAIGPKALKPDDIIKLRSGKTVEVNNTDAEGRLVLADGVAWAAEMSDVSRIIDMATLTGAQPMSTGKDVAAIYSSSESLETLLVRRGRECGELCHPLPYLPELFKQEFTSQVASMKNSVKNRANGQSACAAQFIANHLGAFSGEWAHVDICGPSWSNGRATGYGVGLLLSTL